MTTARKTAGFSLAARDCASGTDELNNAKAFLRSDLAGLRRSALSALREGEHKGIGLDADKWLGKAIKMNDHLRSPHDLQYHDAKDNWGRLVRKIKERHEWSEPPILVCTSLKPTSINNAIPMQGWKYPFKPIKADSLLQMVKEAISQQRAVLQNPDQTMAQIGMDSQAFLLILDEFLKVVKDKIALLEERIKQQSDDPLDL